MPLKQAGSVEAFWDNYGKLYNEFKNRYPEKKAKAMAYAAAAEVMRKHGGDPSKIKEN